MTHKTDLSSSALATIHLASSVGKAPPGSSQREMDGPPFFTRAGLIRFLATTWNEDMLAPSFRKAAARDPKLVWDVERQRYRYHDIPSAPQASPSGGHP